MGGGTTPAMTEERLNGKSESFEKLDKAYFTDFPNAKAHYGAIAPPLGVG
jgi:hypothetical protein